MFHRDGPRNGAPNPMYRILGHIVWQFIKVQKWLVISPDRPPFSVGSVPTYKMRLVGRGNLVGKIQVGVSPMHDHLSLIDLGKDILLDMFLPIMLHGFKDFIFSWCSLINNKDGCIGAWHHHGKVLYLEEM
jgi:hypothetical protein